MKRISKICCILLSVFAVNIATADQATRLSNKINNLLSKVPDDPSIGIIIKDLKNNKILYQLNPNRNFEPASTTKVLTATAALQVLGGDFRFQTKLAHDGTINTAGVLQGNLYLSFSGDPTLELADLEKLLNNLSQKSIKQINGDLIVYVSNFPTYRPGHGFMWDDLNFCYEAPSDAVILNSNCFGFMLQPSKTINGLATISSKQSLAYTPVTSNVQTQTIDHLDCQLNLSVDKYNHYQLDGCMSYQQHPYQFFVAVNQPRYFLQQFLVNWLQTNHIKLTGQIKFSNTPYKAQILASHDSEPLAHLLDRMLKKSDDLYANVIFKTVGAIFMNGSASWHNGSHAVIEVLQQMGIETKYINLVDGAGLSRYNRFSPSALLQILQYNYDHPKVGHYFYNALAIAGQDGTLANFKLATKNAFRGKTGTMYGVAGLAGYLYTADNQRLAVVIMINGSDKTHHYYALARAILDATSTA